MKSKKSMADRADRYRLYEKAVQCPDPDLDFAEQVFKERNGRKPLSLREDFCASALLACSWVRRDDNNTALGVDLDDEVLRWGQKHHVNKMSPARQSRIKLIQGDVMTTTSKKADLVLALNFSYWIFKDKKPMVSYFRNVRRNLARDGLLILDCYGGSSAFQEMKEKRKCGKFTYIWQQESFDPVTHHASCYIHFRFPDKSWLKKAFSYEWRVWTLPELRELLHESGFASDIYWEGEDEDGEGNGEYSLLQGKASADEAWICYLVAYPRG